MPAALERRLPLRVLHEVGAGPMSAMLTAQEASQDDVSLVVLKVMRERWHRDRELLDRAIAVTRRLARLEHRHIVAARSVVWVEDRLAMLQPHVHGLDLLDWFELLNELKVRAPVRVVCELVKGVASALDTALNRVPWGDTEPLGVVHRDLKPTNVMVDRDGEVKVLDFATGLTSLGGRDARAAALRHGLAKYLSPGRREGRRAQPASDVYALGIMALELLRGSWMRRLRSSNPAHDRHLAEVVANLTDLGLPTSKDEMALRNIVLRMVAFDPEARPPASEVVHTFRRLADRASGPSLETFAQQHLVPFVAPVPDDPDTKLGLLTVRAADRRDADDGNATGRRSGITTVVPDDPDDDWEETASGWQRVPNELRNPLDTEDTLPSRQRVAQPPGADKTTPLHSPPTRPMTDIEPTPATSGGFAIAALTTVFLAVALLAGGIGAMLALLLSA